MIDVMLLGHYIEMKSVIGASKALEKLAELMPDKAHLIQGNQIVDIQTAQLKPGDMVLVKAGEKIPADGSIIKGSSYLNQSMLTGESKPVKKIIAPKITIDQENFVIHGLNFGLSIAKTTYIKTASSTNNLKYIVLVVM